MDASHVILRAAKAFEHVLRMRKRPAYSVGQVVPHPGKLAQRLVTRARMADRETTRAQCRDQPAGVGGTARQIAINVDPAEADPGRTISHGGCHELG